MAAAESRMNLAALQQRDPYITEIVDTATQVALYSFSAKSNEWEKTEIEGTLFVYSRSASPFNGFMILNRLGLNNLIEPLTKDHEFQRQDPFLLYRNSNSIYGIWFYDKDECARIGRMLNSLVQLIVEGKAAKTRPKRRSSESDTMSRNVAPKGVDILQMLSRAQEEYDTSKGSEPKTIITNPSAVSRNSPNIVKPTAVKAPTLENHQEGTNPLGNAAIDLDRLFRNASIQHNKEQTNSDQPTDLSASLRTQSILSSIVPQTDNHHSHPTLQKLKSIPGTTLEEIERQQRGEVSSKQQPPPSYQQQPLAPPSSSLDAELKRQLNIIPNSKDAKDSVHNPSVLSNPSVLARQLSATSLQSQPIKIPQTTCKTVSIRSTLPHDILLSPMAFQSSLNSNGATKDDVSPPVVGSLRMTSAPVPQPNRSTSSTGSGDALEVNPLTREQMQQAMLYLIKNDPDFMSMLHGAYVKSLTELASKKS